MKFTIFASKESQLDEYQSEASFYRDDMEGMVCSIREYQDFQAGYAEQKRKYWWWLAWRKVAYKVADFLRFYLRNHWQRFCCDCAMPILNKELREIRKDNPWIPCPRCERIYENLCYYEGFDNPWSDVFCIRPAANLCHPENRPYRF